MAREMLIASEKSLKVERFNLGARLGQCCGGMATLSFEPIGTQQNPPRAVRRWPCGG